MTRLPGGLCLLVTDIDAPTGGIQKNSRLLLKELHNRGVATYACVRNYQRLPRKGAIEGTVVHRSRVVGRRLALNGILYFAETLWWLIRHSRKYDLIHCQQMFGPTMVAAVASYFVKKPILTRVTSSGCRGELADIASMSFPGLRRRLLGRVDQWIALSAEMKQELVEFGIAADRVRIIYNSTDLPTEAELSKKARSQCRRRLKLSNNRIAVFLGRLAEEKNLDVLIKAWGQVVVEFPSAQLLLLGEGGAFRNVELTLTELVRDLGLIENVKFLGHVDAPKQYLLASDAFVLPTGAEGMSNALVEAFACGTAIVATDIPANSELCVEGENALLVPVLDARSLAEAIKRIFASASLAERLGRAARRKAEDCLSIDQMMFAYMETYQAMLASKG